MDDFMRAALAEARAGFDEGGAPIGSVVVKDGRIMGRGRNRFYQAGDPISHAEIEALRDAALGAPALDAIDPLLAGGTVYTTMLPCEMCTGAIIRFGIAAVVVGEMRSYVPSPTEALMTRHGIAVTVLDEPDCVALVAAYLDRYPERRPAMTVPPRFKG